MTDTRMNNAAGDAGAQIKSLNIYDDSQDLHRAIAMSDGMISDPSSLVAMYSGTSNPVMVQDTGKHNISAGTMDELLHSDVISFGTQLLTIDEFEKAYPEHYNYWLTVKNAGQSKFVIVFDCDYGTSAFLNAIYKLDEENGKAEFFKSFPDEKNEPWLYSPPLRIGNKLIFVPGKSRKWAFYDIEKDEWSYETLPDAYHPSIKWRGAFGAGFVYGDDIIFMPGESGAFAKYNVNTGEISYFTTWFNKVKSHVKNVDWGIINGVLYYKKSLLFLTSQTNIAVEINPQNMEVVRTYRIGNGDTGFRTGVQIPHTDTVYLIKFREPNKDPWMETIVKWDIATEESKEFTKFPVLQIEKTTLNLFSHFVFWNGAVYVMPLQCDAILRLDTATDTFSRIELTPKFDFFERKNEQYIWAKDMALPYLFLNGRRMTFVAQLPYDYSLVDIDFETGVISNRRKWRVNGVEKLYTDIDWSDSQCFYESWRYDLSDFIDDVVSDCVPEVGINLDKDNVTASRGTCGESIYNYVKSQLLGE